MGNGGRVVSIIAGQSSKTAILHRHRFESSSGINKYNGIFNGPSCNNIPTQDFPSKSIENTFIIKVE